MHSTDFLLIIPECFQTILLNVFILFAICFSSYNTRNLQAENLAGHLFNPFLVFLLPSQEQRQTANAFSSTQRAASKSQVLSSDSRDDSACLINPEPVVLPRRVVKTSYAYISTPIALIEPLIQLIILSLVCCSLLYLNNPIPFAIGLADSIIWDNLGRLVSIIICASAAGALALGVPAIKRYGRYEFLFIIWLSILGMLCLIKSYNFLTFYLSIELQSLSFYMLAAMRSRTEASAEAGLKYFILSAFSSAILLLGISLIYAAIGSQSFADLNTLINYFYSNFESASVGQATELVLNGAAPYFASPELAPQVRLPAGLSLGLGCVCVSLLFKLAAAPFHAWIADVYEGSPMPVTAFFAITAKIGASVALIRILELRITTFELLPFIAVLSLIIGSFSAMRQAKLKRLIAFSGVANVGWFLLALATGQWQLLIIHLLVYILLSTCLFSIFVLPLFRTHPSLAYRQRLSQDHTTSHIVDHGTDSLNIKYINDLNQLHKSNPSLALAMVIAFFSLAGIPPFAGFYSKYLIINALTQTEQYLALAVALACAILSAFYYIRIIKTVYFAPQIGPEKAVNQDKFKMFTVMCVSFNAYICALTTIATVLFFIKPDYFCIWVALV
jgi:NADH-quinone oxidoreductase subunit N